MRKSAGLIASVIITAAALAGCASTGSTTAAAGAQPSAAPSSVPSSSSPPSCADRFASWRDSGGLSDLQAVQGDLGTLSGAATAMSNDITPGTEAALQQASASLQADTATAQADLPPSCVPGLRRDVSAALASYDKAAVEAGQSVAAASTGSYSLATSDIVAAGRALNAGNGKIGKATTAMKAFSG